MKTNIMRGDTVVCENSRDAEAFVSVNEVYRVNTVSHRGLFLVLDGVSQPLASNRFRRITLIPPNQTKEISLGSN